MSRLIKILGIFVVFSCKSQQVYPLKTDYTEIPQNSYLKDINNELDSFVGNWQGSYNGNLITLFITKETQKFFNKSGYKYYKDILSVKYVVKNSSGIVLQNTQNMTFQANQLTHTLYSRWAEDNGNSLLLYYGGTNCSVGWGSVKLKKNSAIQISWEYRPNDMIIDDTKCPPGTDINIYLPETKDLVFTKQ
ncbi:DUF6705 family protein [Chryseobacterium sp. BIGb0232]|uniref:DUF6705 family protein n=1 Tax=Chryseobacterium sp. BIGb0232 TaxID=2940598 RepID=UPI000F47898E|nr:DUF6705 family protein [Chryseobacterium sp. BIGb0232]MCS4303752.1 hypothetical protein [Chryseobacterium sp. BIGb0232]ROS10450.1 hypothetical protein EDF65_4332 [Chryseobacterium nakagawai]